MYGEIKITISLDDLTSAFNSAEAMTSKRFNYQLTEMETEDGDIECPICYFRQQVKQMLGLDH